jgi:predicted PurR-regulated permease PerM
MTGRAQGEEDEPQRRRMTAAGSSKAAEPTGLDGGAEAGPRANGGTASGGTTGGASDRAATEPGSRSGLHRALEWHRVPFGTIVATVGIVAATYLLGEALYRLRDVVLVMLVSGFVALLLDPLVVALERHGLRRRGLAVAVVTLLALLVFGALGAAFGYPLVNGLTHFAHALPRYVKQAQSGHGWIGHLVLRFHIESWVEKNSSKLVSFAESLSKPVISVGKGAISAIGSLIVMFVMVLLLLLEGPRMRTALLGTQRPASAARWRRLGAEIMRSVSGFMLGNLATSCIGGVVVLVTFALLSVPYALLWALWFALVDFLPEVGGALAIVPAVLFAFTHSLAAGIVSAVVFLAYWQIENRLMNPVIMSRTVRVNPLLVFVSVVVGAGIGSWVGGIFGAFATGLIAIPAAAAGQAVVRDVRRELRPAKAATSSGDEGR